MELLRPWIIYLKYEMEINKAIIPVKKKCMKVRRINSKPIARLFAFWLSIPNGLKEIQSDRIAKLGYEIEDKKFAEIIVCKNKTVFAERFGISLKQLCIWEKSEPILKMVEEFNKQCDILKYKKALDHAFTNKAIAEADAPRVRLWYEIFCGKTAEGMPPAPVVQNIQVNQKIIKIGQEYEEKVKQILENEIRGNK